jgi:hypothetical protein
LAGAQLVMFMPVVLPDVQLTLLPAALSSHQSRALASTARE